MAIKEIEEWNDIPGYEGRYQASTLGNIKSLNFNKTGKEKLLKPIINNSQYYNIKLSKNGKVKTIQLHKIIAICFLNHIPDGMNEVIDHIDGNKYNNRLDNLRVCSARDNVSFKNRKDSSNFTSKYIGVSFDNITNKWRSQIYFNKKKYHLGFFEKEIDAATAYNNKLNEIKYVNS